MAEAPVRAPILERLLTWEQDEIRTTLSEAELRKAEVFNLKKVSGMFEEVQGAGQESEVEGMATDGIASTRVLSRRYIEQYSLTADYQLSPATFVDRRTNSVE